MTRYEVCLKGITGAKLAINETIYNKLWIFQLVGKHENIYMTL